MEHNDAVRLQAVEKYMLGELSPDVRDEFEAHFFDCAVCSFNLRAGIAFATGARQFFAERRTPVIAMEKPGWFAWLKPMIAVPVFAALIFLVGYQNLVSIPHLKQINSAASEMEARPWFPLMDASVKGSAGSHIEVEKGKAFSLFFDITTPPRQPDSIYLVHMKDSSGNILTTERVSQQMIKKAVIFNVPAGVSEGEYKLVILDQAGGSTTSVGELPFTVAFYSQIQQH
ncbi:MAG TPA: hypothetical protein VEU98_02130 [Candidatus Eremiobacteraceae bacterium]|nr:hypothetical protein [Candidatus Eremiobacteraceae bacterium]